MFELIRHVFAITARTWKIDGEAVRPTENDVRKVLDSAAEALYDEEVGSTFTMGGLYIEKTTKGMDVYVHVGEYV